MGQIYNFLQTLFYKKHKTLIIIMLLPFSRKTKQKRRYKTQILCFSRSEDELTLPAPKTEKPVFSANDCA